MAEIAFINDKTGKKYTVVKFDKEAGKVELKDAEGFTFTEVYNKELFQKLGYKLAPVAAA